MADVGDGHIEGEIATGLFLDTDAIVEVPGAFAVDGYHRQLPQVQAVLQNPGRQLERNLLGLGQHLRGKLIRQTVFQDDQPGLDRGVLHRAQDLDDGPLGVQVTGGIVGHRGPHHVAGGGARQLLRGNDQVEDEVLVFRLHVVGIFRLAQEAQHLLVPALQDADHLAFLAPAPGAFDPDHHPVAVPGFFQIHGGNVNVLAAGFRGDKTKTVGVH